MNNVRAGQFDICECGHNRNCHEKLHAKPSGECGALVNGKQCGCRKFKLLRRYRFEKQASVSRQADNARIARRLLFTARELIGIDFPTQDAMDKYLKEHPDADKTNHRVVETKKDAPAKKKPAKLENSSDKYHAESVLPALKSTLRKHVPAGVKLRGSGRKIRNHLELIADIETGKRDGDTWPVQIDIHGSYMTSDDGEYHIRLHSPYIPGDHEYHAKFSGDPQKDAEAISKDMGELLDDFKGFVKEAAKPKK